ncbi:MAG: hypothetical protein ACK58T_50145, partial [Phycisphaerae bacterium]
SRARTTLSSDRQFDLNHGCRQSLYREAIEMIRYWFTFHTDRQLPIGFRIGAGVTANCLDEAIALLRLQIVDLPSWSVVENIDIGMLDPLHVRPNMGNVTIKGIWFPQIG